MRLAFLLSIFLANTSQAADLNDLIAKIRSVGPEGAGASEASNAWKQLSLANGDSLIDVLRGFQGASPIAGNYLRSAIDRIVQRETAARRPLPAAAIQEFLADRQQDSRARRIAYELLVSADPSKKSLLSTFLDDPSLELRYEAIQTAFEAVRNQPKDSAEAKKQLNRLLTSSRDKDQIAAIAKSLEEFGETVDLVKQFGFQTSWLIAGPFDNSDGKGYSKVYPPEKPPLDLKSTYLGKDGRQVAWKPFTTTDKMGVVNLNAIFPRANVPAGGKQKLGEKSVVAFAYTEVELPEARTAEVRAASATALTIYVNGEKVVSRESYHQSFDADSYIAPVKLPAGRSTVLFKVIQNDGQQPWMQEWQFQLRFTDSLGAAIPLKAADFGKGQP